ncbi:hypothetical protein AB0E04_24250 [Streptomyces sp. NPDC048251]|uniref:hypothetical protein n=1 Tax=Streptomyces sp. NPDC048251 TaxID=3154501 RepID=UPI0034231DB5
MAGPQVIQHLHHSPHRHGAGEPGGLVQTYGFKTTTARHVRLQATELGAPATDETTKSRLRPAGV